MRADTKKRKNATRMLRATQEQEWWTEQIARVMLEGKQALDTAMLDVGRLVAETLMYMEREQRSGPDYRPTSPGLMKWASQRGSIYVGDQKLRIEHPHRFWCATRRTDSLDLEIVAKIYDVLRSPASPSATRCIAQSDRSDSTIQRSFLELPLGEETHPLPVWRNERTGPALRPRDSDRFLAIEIADVNLKPALPSGRINDPSTIRSKRKRSAPLYA